jgi:GT2 family glycosyltransferase
LLLNSDTYLTEDSISIMAANLNAEPKIGVACCRMVYPDGGLQYAARRFRSISWELLDAFRFTVMLIPYKKRAQLMLGRYFKNDFDTACDWVSGAFFMFRKNIIDQLPGKKLDDRFFMYGEDHLWCWQIKQLGYTTCFFSNTTIVHINNGSTSISKQLKLRRTMLDHELIIMKERKGNGIYYILFSIIYSAKENTRNAVKYTWVKLTGKMMR